MRPIDNIEKLLSETPVPGMKAGLHRAALKRELLTQMQIQSRPMADNARQSGGDLSFATPRKPWRRIMRPQWIAVAAVIAVVAIIFLVRQTSDRALVALPESVHVAAPGSSGTAGSVAVPLPLTSNVSLMLSAVALLGQSQSGSFMEQWQPDSEEESFEQKNTREEFNGKTYLQWSKELQSEDVGVQEKAAAALKFYGLAARAEVPRLLELMRSTDVGVRVLATITLGFIGADQKDAENAVSRLKDLLIDPQQIVRFQAARTLARFAANKENRINCFAATQALTKLLHPDQNSWEVRAAAATALGWVAWTDKGFDQPTFYALLKAGTSDPCAEVRMNCVLALVLFGKPAAADDLKREEEALKLLTNEKQEKYNKKVAIWAYVCLLRIADKVSATHLQALSRFLKNKDVEACANAARAFAVIGPTAASQVPALCEACTMDEDPTALRWIITALGNMGDKAKAAAPHLEKLRLHKDPAVQAAAAKALEDIQEKREEKDDPDKKSKKE
jgi:HEAT repeat protein